MTDRVNGQTSVGEFLTGNMDFYTIATIAPVAQTNVDALPVDVYGTSTTWPQPTVVDGAGVAQTYATQADYMDAWVKQQNLNTIVNTFAMRANPVAVSVACVTVASSNVAVSAINSALFNFSNLNALTATFGTTTYAKQVNVIRIATEKTSTWLVDTTTKDDNTTGYQLLGGTGLDGVTVYDTQATVGWTGRTALPSVTTTYGSYTLYTNALETGTGTTYNVIAQRQKTML